MSIVVIGKNSFLASHLREHLHEEACLFLGHDEALTNSQWIDDAKIVLNFAFHPALRNSAYEPQHDIDLAIAQRIKNTDAHYIMMSSRMVYGGAPDTLYLDEEMAPAPCNNYGLNKWETEQALAKTLPLHRLTILRMGNIFGSEEGRSSFIGMMIEGLKTENTIRFNIAPDSQRDFLSVWQWGVYMKHILQNIQPGTYNIGSGFGTTAQQISDWVIEARGSGESAFTGNSYEGQFVLNIEKSRNIFDLPPYSPEHLKTDIIRALRV